jgi:molybdopterin/thiamine biosynthesis adenylyltransferase
MPDMTVPAEPVLSLAEGRFARLEAIPWWRQPLLGEARVLVIGAGALGNEVLKNLALLGVGHLAVADMDNIEASNLCRSVLFREADQGRPKAEAAVTAARDLYPGLHATAVVGNVLADLGLGWFRWAQVVVGCLDNREARVFVNRACAQVRRPWIDGGIDVLGGIVRGFAPPATACYECTMGQADWDLLAKRRSCSLLARLAWKEGGTPTTPTTASVIGGLQVQEVVKLLHGMDALLGKGYVFEGLGHSSYAVGYPISPDCPWHEEPGSIEAVADFTSDTPLRAVAEWAAGRLGGLDAIDLSRELVEKLECPSCGQVATIWQPADRIGRDQAMCGRCQMERIPHFIHSIAAGSPLLDLSPRKIGLPAWDVVWARRGSSSIGLEFAGDRAGCGV